MLHPDFSEIQNNGFRITQFRLTHKMRSPEYFASLKKYEIQGDLIGVRNHVINYLIEQNEIDFTIYYFSLRLTYLLIIAELLSLVFLQTGLGVAIISGLLSLIFYLVAHKYKQFFILGNFGIQLSEDFYNSKILEKYSF